MITKKLLTAGCVLALSTGVAFAEGMDKERGQMGSSTSTIQGTQWQFGQLDSNKDNKVTKQELRDRDVNVANFDEYDANNDGALDEQEFAAISEE